MAVDGVIRITDLADPEYTDAQSAMRELAEGFVVSFAVEDLLAETRNKLRRLAPTLDGDDPELVGAPGVVERLEVLGAAVDADRGLHASGRARVWLDVIRYLVNRALVVDTVRRHPEIREEEIARPVIVAGLPRSGTTHLVNLLAADSRFRSLPYWESLQPVPYPDEAPTVPGEDPRYTRAREEWEQTDALMPLLKAMHPLDPDHVHEEVELIAIDVAGYVFEWLFTAPAWRDHYLATDQTPHYAFMRTVLQVLQWQDRRAGIEPRRWVLKCPQHLEQLPVLRTTFPDATVAITHRDPTSVIASSATMNAYGDRMRRVRPDPPAVAAYWADRVELLLGRCVADREVWPGDQSIDVLFHEFMADDLAVVERIHTVAGLDTPASTQAELRSFLDDHPRGRFGRVVTDLTADFGVDRDQLRRRYDAYLDRFGVKPEGMGE